VLSSPLFALIRPLTILIIIITIITTTIIIGTPDIPSHSLDGYDPSHSIHLPVPWTLCLVLYRLDTSTSTSTTRPSAGLQAIGSLSQGQRTRETQLAELSCY
jgi:hypothetical protein